MSDPRYRPPLPPFWEGYISETKATHRHVEETLLARIEALTAERDALAQERDDLAALSGEDIQLCRQLEMERDEAVAERDALAEKLAMAVEALGRLVALDDDYSPFGGEMLQDRVERTWQEARATLAQITGGKTDG